MLEKGLIMRPRRATFAEGYIRETVELAANWIAAGGFSDDESKWVRHVLGEYFQATSQSDSDIVSGARARWETVESLSGGAEGVRSHVPLPRTTDSSELPTIKQLSDLATSRRSVRWYTSQTVPPLVVQAAVRVAMESPTACNRQPFRFLQIEDAALRRKVASIPGGTAGFAEQLPGLIVVVGDQSAYFDERDRHLIYIDSALATMALIFALESQGVASCVINWPDVPAREAAMRAALSLPDHEQVTMLVAFGYEDVRASAPFSAKKSLASAHEVRW